MFHYARFRFGISVPCLFHIIPLATAIPPRSFNPPLAGLYSQGACMYMRGAQIAKLIKVPSCMI
jgi:hypothetical protein